MEKNIKVYASRDFVEGAGARKADLSHMHTISDVANLKELLDTKSMVKHIHTTSDIDGLSDRLSEAWRIRSGSFGGEIAAGESFQNPDVSLLRNSKLVSAELTESTPSNNGEIFWTYE